MKTTHYHTITAAAAALLLVLAIVSTPDFTPSAWRPETTTEEVSR